MLRWLSFRSKAKNQSELKLIRFFIKKFGYRPRNLQIFKTAITHKSIANISKGVESNERLEFLGDTILDAVIADFLYHKFPLEDEGYLTKVKAKIVSRKNLTKIAKDMQLHEMLIYQKGRGINVETLEGNAFEAIIGAIYLDDGYVAAEKSIKNHILKNFVDLPTLLENEIDFKSQLFIWAQKNRLTIDFNLIKEEIVDGKWNYEVEVFINSSPFGRGKGSTKKMAEQVASKQTLELLG